MTVVRRRPLGPLGAAADFGLACLLLAVAPLVLAEGERLGTWVAFQSAYALSVVMTASGVRSLALAVVGLLGVIGCYFLFLGEDFDGHASTAVGNVITFIVYTAIPRLFVNYTRRVARDADASRARAAELARREEERRAQLMMHNGVAVMRLLTEPGTDEERARLIDLAEVELRRMRSYLRGREPDTADAPEAVLTALVRQVCDRFTDLPVDALLDLGVGVRLPAAQAEAVERALESLLLNVRAHARAEQVVVHLDQGPDGWTLTVSDDGVGFDPATRAVGVGLREVVVGELRRQGCDVEIESAVGDGTTVTISSVPAPARAAREAR
ncbi:MULTISPECIES: sensor histidine kinase [Saccharothrix]|uniref:sensor histidine kinase n=1 Tax=Saccharothrix TaxID=2071 RepID=UPI0018E9E514|nr:ATP-binding protein [Saccharothrix sp. CB00851]